MNAAPYSARRLAASSTILGACLLLGAMMGCGDDNPVKPPNPGPKYLASSTPQNTLENLRRAYTTRDSTGYDSLFDPRYQGTSIQSGMPLIAFTYSDERRHIGALANAASITSVELFFPPLTRTTDLGDPPGWATIQVQNVLLQVNDGTSSLNLEPDETMEFKFAPTTPSAGSPTDTTWHVIRWTEIAP